MEIMKALQMTTTAIKDWVNKKTPTQLTVDEDNLLYLSNENGILSEGIQLPQGGGGGSSGYVILKNLLGDNTITVALGSPVKLKFSFESTEDESGGQMLLYVGGMLKDTYKIIQGVNEIDISEYIGEGSNDIKITCSDIYSNSKSLSYIVNAINLKITSTFDDSQIYNGDINIRYVPYGAIEKDVVFEIDGTIYDTITTSSTGKQLTYSIPAMNHGSHALKIYMTSNINGADIKSNELVYDVLCVVDGQTDSMISSAYNIKSITQGELISIPFTVYDPSNMSAQVTLTITQGENIYSTTTRTVDRTKQFWSTRDYPVGDVTFTITYGTISKLHTITVVESSVNITVKYTDMEFQLRSAGKSNADDNRDVWENNGVTTVFNDINWDNTGWIEDENGDTALRLSGEAKATINFKPFETDARSTGRTIELEFAIRDVNNRDAVAISCLKDGVGFTVTADTATFTSEQSKITCNYADENKVHVSFVIEPKTDYRLMMIYLNGVLSGAIQYPDNDNFQQSPALDITLGSPYCSVDLYCIRSYRVALTMDEIRDNYIADVTDVSKKLALIADNDIYDIYGKINFSKVQSKIPVLVITGELPKAKGDKKDVVVTWTDPNNPQFNYEDTGKIDVQGTSSQYSKFGYRIEKSVC